MSSEQERRVDDRSVASLLAETILTSSQTQLKIDNLATKLTTHIEEEENNKNEYLSGFERRSPAGHVESHRALEGYVKVQAMTNTIVIIFLAIQILLSVINFYLHFLK